MAAHGMLFCDLRKMTVDLGFDVEPSCRQRRGAALLAGGQGANGDLCRACPSGYRWPTVSLL